MDELVPTKAVAPNKRLSPGCIFDLLRFNYPYPCSLQCPADGLCKE